MKSLLLIILLLAFNVSIADIENDGAYLDAPYSRHIHPKNDIGLETFKKQAQKKQAVSAYEIMKQQSVVKSQGRRGTCSIFSATALLEFYLIKNEISSNPDLSEQWLEYLTAGQRGSEGSWSGTNFTTYGNYGYVDESNWAYNPKSWHPYDPTYWQTTSNDERLYFEKRCNFTLDTVAFEGCLIGQRDPRLLKQSDENLTQELVRDNTGNQVTNPFFDPEFLQIRQTAKKNVSPLMISNDYIYGQTEIKDLLNSGEALTLDVDFYYGAWNHGKGATLGLNRNMDNWSRGIVTYPHPKSLDYEISKLPDNRAGHSVVIVGYDDDMIIEKTEATKDGKGIKVKTKGVYFFKNSWGKDSFGVNFKMDDESFPGFGVISMKYAHEHGTFHKMVFESR